TRYFPSMDGDVVVADLPTWLTAANTAEPGVTTPSELWVDAGPGAAAALTKLPLSATSQRARERELRTDPLARGAIALLLVTALVGLVLAAVGLQLTVAGDLRDDRGALFDLEAQGATPAEIRRHVPLRAAVAGVLGVGARSAAGPSGSGTSTLLRILAGLDRPSAGTVSVLGHDLRTLRGRALDEYRSRTLGYADQHYTRALAPELTARQLVGLRLALLGMRQAERDGVADRLLERVGLLDRAEALPQELSGGQQQRVAICAALAHRPRLFIADEPTGEL